MKLSALCVTLSLVAFSGALGAQTVYKCTSPSGVKIFSSEPCGKDAKATTYREPDASDEAARSDTSCRNTASNIVFRANIAGIESAKAEMDALTKSSHRGTTAENEAWKRNAQARMEILQEYVSQEEARIALQTSEAAGRQSQAVAACDKQKSDRQSQLAREAGGSGATAPL